MCMKKKSVNRGEEEICYGWDLCLANGKVPDFLKWKSSSYWGWGRGSSQQNFKDVFLSESFFKLNFVLACTGWLKRKDTNFKGWHCMLQQTNVV